MQRCRTLIGKSSLKLIPKPVFPVNRIALICVVALECQAPIRVLTELEIKLSTYLRLCSSREISHDVGMMPKHCLGFISRFL